MRRAARAARGRRPLFRIVSSLARELHDPVRFPALPAVRREGLLPAASVRAVGRPDEAQEDRATLELILAVELSSAVAELADHRRVERAGVAVRPMNAPLARPSVVQSKRESAEEARRLFCHVLLDVGLSVPQRPFL